MDYIYDVETYPNCFTITFVKTQPPHDVSQFVVNDKRNDSLTIKIILAYFQKEGHRLVGFNNLNFDYPIIHLLIESGYPTAQLLYDKAMAIINSAKQWEHSIPPYEQHVKQLDLFKIHHFDNPAKRTGLKDLEFCMRSPNIEPLPFPPGTILNDSEIKMLLSYNKTDCFETLKFYEKSRKEIEFRERLSNDRNYDFTNANDIKIGVKLIVSKMEAVKPGICYDPYSRKPRQTRRASINLGECIDSSIQFNTAPLKQIHNWLKEQTITNTKNVFTNLQSSLDSVALKFGTGGLHGAVEFREYHSNESKIIDVDAASYYSSIAVNYNLYPEHLGQIFCQEYGAILNQRLYQSLDDFESKTFKLSLNGVFGNSNNTHSVFYDPKFTMSITLNGQLLMCLLCEKAVAVKGVRLIQVNTDGATFYVPKAAQEEFKRVCDDWRTTTGILLKSRVYKNLFIRDVNNYLGVMEDGTVIAKGAFNHKKQWHQDHSSLIVPKAVEAHLLHGAPLSDYIRQHQDIYDFMLRVKLTREKKLVYTKIGKPFPTQLHNFTRYYVSDKGGYLQKIMPPLKGKNDVRLQAIESGWFVTPCNNIKDATNPINHDYYIDRAEKLTLPMRPF